MLSVYPATEGLSFKVIRGIIDAHLDELLPLVTEYLPPDVLARARRAVASATRCAWCIARRRSPRRWRGARGSRSRSCSSCSCSSSARRRSRARRGAASASRTSAQLTTQLREALPFQLTGAQARVLREIFADMCSDRRMQRLLQGDVGSGKTIVALFAALLAMENGYQAAIMAPTELLAEQHVALDDAAARAARHRADSASPAASKAKARREVAARLADARPALVVGTHALVQEATAFAQARPRRRRRAASLRRRAAQGARRQGRVARRAAHDRDADSALARAHALRRSRSLHPRRAAARTAADHDRAAPRVGARARARSSSIASSSRGARRTSSIR